MLRFSTSLSYLIRWESESGLWCIGEVNIFIYSHTPNSVQKRREIQKKN